MRDVGLNGKFLFVALAIIISIIPSAVLMQGVLAGSGYGSWVSEFTGTVTVGESVSASITDFSPAIGTYYPGQPVTSSLRFKNTGNVRWTFYVGYSVQDKNGKWYHGYVPLGAPTSVTLDPGATSDWINRAWNVPSSPVTGKYKVVMAVWKTNPDTDPNAVRLDSREKADSFTVGLTPTIESFTLTITPGEMKEVKVKITNPNDFSISIASVSVVDQGGFKGTVTIVSYPSIVAANSSGEITIRITPDTDCPKGTHTIRFRATGGP